MVEEKLLETDSQTISYKIAGAGKPVVLLHGFAEDSTIWQHQVEYLTNSLPDRNAKFKLIIADIPGSGKSTIGNKPWTMESFAESIKQILDNESIDSCIMIGHSMGGYIALAFAENFPGSLAALGLFHSTAFADNEEKKTTRLRGIEFIRKNGSAKFLEQSIPNLFSEDFKKRHPEKVQELIDRYTNFSEGSLVHYYEAMMQRPDRTDLLKKFGGPVLFIMGKQDSAIPLTDSLKQCHLPGLSYIHMLNNSGHMDMWEETANCNQILEKFLKDIGNGTWSGTFQRSNS